MADTGNPFDILNNGSGNTDIKSAVQRYIQSEDNIPIGDVNSKYGCDVIGALKAAGGSEEICTLYTIDPIALQSKSMRELIHQTMTIQEIQDVFGYDLSPFASLAGKSGDELKSLIDEIVSKQEADSDEDTLYEEFDDEDYEIDEDDFIEDDEDSDADLLEEDIDEDDLDDDPIVFEESEDDDDEILLDDDEDDDSCSALDDELDDYDEEELYNEIALTEEEKRINKMKKEVGGVRRLQEGEFAGLALGFGSRGTPAAVATYHPDKIIINLTKMRGAGSLAHELGHAIDHYCLRILGLSGFSLAGRVIKNDTKIKEQLYAKYPIYSSQIDSTDDPAEIEKIIAHNKKMQGIGTALFKAMKIVTNSMIYADDKKQTFTDYFINACIMSGISRDKIPDNKIYNIKVDLLNSVDNTESSAGGRKSMMKELNKAHELFARAFESFIEDELVKNGMLSQYLVHSTYNECYTNRRSELSIFKPYPSGIERARIDVAIRQLINIIKWAIGADAFPEEDRKVMEDKDNFVSYFASVVLAQQKKSDELFEAEKNYSILMTDAAQLRVKKHNNAIISDYANMVEVEAKSEAAKEKSTDPARDESIKLIAQLSGVSEEAVIESLTANNEDKIEKEKRKETGFKLGVAHSAQVLTDAIKSQQEVIELSGGKAALVTFEDAKIFESDVKAISGTDLQAPIQAATPTLPTPSLVAPISIKDIEKTIQQERSGDTNTTDSEPIAETPVKEPVEEPAKTPVEEPAKAPVETPVEDKKPINYEELERERKQFTLDIDNAISAMKDDKRRLDRLISDIKAEAQSQATVTPQATPQATTQATVQPVVKPAQPEVKPAQPEVKPAQPKVQSFTAPQATPQAEVKPAQPKVQPFIAPQQKVAQPTQPVQPTQPTQPKTQSYIQYNYGELLAQLKSVLAREGNFGIKTNIFSYNVDQVADLCTKNGMPISLVVKGKNYPDKSIYGAGLIINRSIPESEQTKIMIDELSKRLKIDNELETKIMQSMLYLMFGLNQNLFGNEGIIEEKYIRAMKSGLMNEKIEQTVQRIRQMV